MIERLTGAVLLRQGEPLFVAPAFEEPRLRRTVPAESQFQVWQEDESPYARLRKCAARRGRRDRPPRNRRTDALFCRPWTGRGAAAIDPGLGCGNRRRMSPAQIGGGSRPHPPRDAGDARYPPSCGQPVARGNLDLSGGRFSPRRPPGGRLRRRIDLRHCRLRRRDGLSARAARATELASGRYGAGRYRVPVPWLPFRPDAHIRLWRRHAAPTTTLGDRA